MSTTVRAIIGANVRATRMGCNLTYADMVRGVRQHGVRWSTGRLAQIERGDGAATIESLLILALTLSDLTGESVTPADLLTTDEDVELAPGEELTGESFLDVFMGRTTELEVRDVPGAEDRLKKQLLGMTADMQEIQEIAGETLTFRQYEAAKSAYGLADERVTKKLGMTDNQLIGWSLRLWGKVLSQEAEERAGEGATAQKKGHITRALVKELAEAVKR